MASAAKKFFNLQMKKLLLAVHKAGLRAGVVLIPNHYYADVPDLHALRRTTDLWARKSALIGIDVDLDGQVRRLHEVCQRFEPEFRDNRVYREACAADGGPGFGYIEAQALHAVVRHFKPKTILEVGSGVSTRCSLFASDMNAREGAAESEIICIEPHPRPWLRQASIKLIERPVQQVGLEVFEQLEAGSLLFIDSTHTVKTGSDVNYLVLEVLPRLKPGVIVHFHDIYLPYDYPREALDSFFQPQETALLHAFLIGNRNVRLLFSLSQLHYARREELAKVFPEYRPQRERDGIRDRSYPVFGNIEDHFPASTYLEIVGEHGVVN
jgi:hypothetical protein